MAIVHFTSSSHQFTRAVAEGDLYRALGVSEDARKLDIDVAAARVSDRAPQLAGQVTAVANVLTNRDLRATYQILCELRDSVCQMAADGYGEALQKLVLDHRTAIWEKCCELLRFDLHRFDLVIGPKGAASLAKVGEDWVINSVLRSRSIVLSHTDEELLAGSLTRELWYAVCPLCRQPIRVACARKRAQSAPSAGSSNEGLPIREFDRRKYNYYVPPCPNCRVRGIEPSEYDDTYTFRVYGWSPGGDVVQGEGHCGGTVIHAILDGLPTSYLLPLKLLEEFYSAQQNGQDLAIYEVDPQKPKRRRARVDKSKYPNPRGERICCLGCGRDTRAMSGYCGCCVGRIPNKCSADEEEGRSVRSPEVVDNTPIEYECRESFADQRYHGESRDDV